MDHPLGNDLIGQDQNGGRIRSNPRLLGSADSGESDPWAPEISLKTQCSLELNAVVTLQWNATTKQFELQGSLTEGDTRNGTGSTRHLSPGKTGGNKRRRISGNVGPRIPRGIQRSPVIAIPTARKGAGTEPKISISSSDYIQSAFFDRLRFQDEDLRDSTNRRLGEKGDGNLVHGELIFAQVCDCVDPTSAQSAMTMPKFYCPIETPICIIEWNNDTAINRTIYPSVECLSANSEVMEDFVRYVFPVALFMFLFTIVLCFWSPRGRHAGNYACRLFRLTSEERYKEQLNKELNALLRRRQLIYRYQLRQHYGQIQSSSARAQIPPIAAADNYFFSPDALPPLTPPPTKVSLKTKRFSFSNVLGGNTAGVNSRVSGEHGVDSGTVEDGFEVELKHPSKAVVVEGREQGEDIEVSLSTAAFTSFASNGEARVVQITAGSSSDSVDNEEANQNDEEEGVEVEIATCAICLVDLERGDRVGDLRCCHAFHSDCLKAWIKRRKNHCPLCKAALILESDSV